MGTQNFKKVVVMAGVSFLFLLVMGYPALAVDKVLTIYFAGTGNTEDGAKDLLGLTKYSPELISELYKNDTSQEELTEDHPRYKSFVDGVGSPILSCFGSAADPYCTLPTCCRGFAECLDDAKNAFNEVGESDDLILNLIGYSRGGVLPMIMARWVADAKKRLKR